MTNNDIKKLLELANNNEIDKLKDKLTFLLLQSQDKKQANLYKSVEKYLQNSKKLNENRQVMATLQHYNNKQFICNAYSMCIFDNFVQELENLPTTNDMASLPYTQILPKNVVYTELSKQDNIIINNIKKYIDLYKVQEFYNKENDKKIYIEFGNKIFDIKILKEIIDIMGANIVEIADCGNINGLLLKNGNITSYVLPIRVLDSNVEFINQVRDFTREFVEKMGV